MFRLRSEAELECWSGETGATGTGTGDAMAARELIGDPRPGVRSLALGSWDGYRVEEAGGDGPVAR